MKCEQCGEENLEGSSFCKKCGKVFKKEIPNSNQIVENISQTSTVSNFKNTKNTDDKITIDSDVKSNIDIYCKCGQKLEAGWKFCPKCKEPINVKIVATDDDTANNNQKPFLYILSALIIFLIGYNLGQFIIAYMISFAIIITGKINCKKSIIMKVIYYLMLLFFIYILVGLIAFFIVCGQLRDCPG